MHGPLLIMGRGIGIGHFNITVRSTHLIEGMLNPWGCSVCGAAKTSQCLYNLLDLEAIIADEDEEDVKYEEELENVLLTLVKDSAKNSAEAYRYKVDVVPQHLLIPTDSDPGIWAVQVKCTTVFAHHSPQLVPIEECIALLSSCNPLACSIQKGQLVQITYGLYHKDIKFNMNMSDEMFCTFAAVHSYATWALDQIGLGGNLRDECNNYI
ncbi:hypothetical protein BGW80DRAFT_1257906 [Lactifluus volemus]|nr:hypothetical protein BGW80DRAFT_1257906 [Lactifluus volemus]